MEYKFYLKYIFTISQTIIINNKLSNDFLKFKIEDWFTLSYDNIYNLAVISQNAYFEEKNDISDTFTKNNTFPIGINNDTVKAYLFSSDNDKYHIISFKGTSTIFDKKDTVYNDKLNDNMYYSCCFYEQNSMFKNIKELKDEKCWEKDVIFITQTENEENKFQKKRCKKKCYKAMENHELNYINISKKIIDNIKETLKEKIDFDTNEILFTGHSLGGTLATFMGLLYNKITVTFQSPGERIYTDSVELSEEYKKNANKIYHFGHNADIIFTGKCKGRLSWCYVGGYTIETKCHIGNVCEYDAINELNISESIFTHKLKYVIDNIIPNWKSKLPECKIINNCTDCENWEYI
jgi:lipase ATG15